MRTREAVVIGSDELDAALAETAASGMLSTDLGLDDPLLALLRGVGRRRRLEPRDITEAHRLRNLLGVNRSTVQTWGDSSS